MALFKMLSVDDGHKVETFFRRADARPMLGTFPATDRPDAAGSGHRPITVR